MNYLLKPRRAQRPKFGRALGAVGALFIFCLIIFLSRSTMLVSVFGFVGRPIWRGESSAVLFLDSHIGFFRSTRSLLAENASLKANIADYYALDIDRTVLRQENEALKKVTTSSGEVARVLSSPTESFYDIVVIELVPNSLVAVGDSVYGENDVILGTVLSRSGSFARVKLFSSVGEVTTVRLVKNGTTLFLTGRGGGNLFVEVPRSLDVAEGDAVVVPGFATNILGHVIAIRPGRADSFKNVYVTYPLNIFLLTWVRIEHLAR